MGFNDHRRTGEKSSGTAPLPPVPLEPSLTDQGTMMIGVCPICRNDTIPLRTDGALMWHQATRSVDGKVMDCPGIGIIPV